MSFGDNLPRPGKARSKLFGLTASRQAASCEALEADMLRYQLRHDEVTGLPNRLFLRERLALAVGSPEVHRSLSVLVVDLDRFKPVNELYGSEAGDFLLRQAALRMQRLVSKADKVGRIRGDRFVILHYAERLPGGTIALANQVIHAMSETFIVDGYPVRIGASVGVAVYRPESAGGEAMLLDAETALQSARERGGGQACLFEAKMQLRLEIRRQARQDFCQAIEDRQFMVHYQPIFDCGNLSLSGFEALMRWQHPVHGMVSPAKFIPFAEKTGLITRLGLGVLETACAAAARWPDHLRISINISPVQLVAGDLVDAVAAIVQKTGLSAHRLELEVTEGALIENPAQARATLSQLREMGMLIAIDDFGTGYSNLSYLRHFPFDRIKIDRSLIKNLAGDSDALLIVRAVIDLGHALGVEVLAEGIESEVELKLLREQGCDQVQGFLLGRPAPIGGAMELMDSHVKAADGCL